MTKCPDCERYKLSASVWRNKAYELAGKPLPWKPDELWVGLTDEEISQAVGGSLNETYLRYFRKVLAKIKEKNT